ncbi:MAG: SPOR domain-containing protein [Magnetococcales bacterium]|nr:SPOR domain-containing protein [Magnetococcales bacterium]MBF0261181.1 SPOR domain-containing protein [Magnetococcales bacterium]
MKASPNREQFLFLVTGGIILVLILLVVIFNMVRSPGDLIVEKETQPPPKVKVGDRAGDANKSAWLTQVAPAPIFNTDAGKGEAKPEPRIEIDAKDLTAPDSNAKEESTKSRDPWSAKEASALESARLESKPLPKEVGLSTAKAPPAPTDGHVAPPMPQMATTPGARPAPPPPARGGAQAPNDAKNAAASNKPNPRDPVEESDAGEENPKPQKSAPGNGFTVQVASFNDTEHAEALVAKLSSLMFEGKRMPTFISNPKAGAKTVYRVRLGPFQTQQRAQQAANMAQTKIGGVKAVVLNPGQ